MSENNRIENIYTLTPMQKGMLYHYLLDKKTSEYIEMFSMHLRIRNFHKTIFQQAVDNVVLRHEALRTLFVYEDVDNPMQIVLRDLSVRINWKNLKSESDERQTEIIKKYCDSDICKGFDLSQEILQRITVFELGDEEFKFIWTFHHIIMDGWCLNTLLDEVVQAYRALATGNIPHFCDHPEFHEYIKWLQLRSSNQDMAYWKNYLESYTNVACIPKNCDEINVNKGRASFDSFIDAKQTEKLIQLAAQNNVTISNVIHGIWGILLQKYNNIHDVVFGSVVSGRPTEIVGIDKTVGLFINTVPCRVMCENNTDFIEIIKKINEDFIEGNEHSYIGLGDIQKLVTVGSELINNILVLENFGYEGNSFDSKEAELLNIDSVEVTNYDLDVNVHITDKIYFRINYNMELFNNETMARLSGHVHNIVAEIIGNPNKPIKEISIMSIDEQKNTVQMFNNNTVPIPERITIPRIIENKVVENPEGIAVKFNDNKLTYDQLNRDANQIAHYLSHYIVQHNATIALLMERSDRLLTCILGVWKAGCAYIPMDVNYPIDRILGILQNSGTSIVIVDDDDIYGRIKEEFVGHIINLSQMKKEIEICDDENLGQNISPADLSYVIYTSGSTGKPKGAMVEHAGMLNHIMAKVNDLNLNEKSVIVQNASHCFDISVWQMFSALVCGGITIICDNNLIMEPYGFIKKINEEHVTILEVVPSYLKIILKQIEENKISLPLKFLLVTGEEVRKNLVTHWFDLCDVSMVNAYGPTEVSDDITHHIMTEAPKGEVVPIGRPIQNLNIYIVDDDMHLCPIGVKGEILVSGIGVGRGYLNDQPRTDEVFMVDPFTEQEGVRLYRTGDLGRWLSNGTIEFYGRKDYQVKIRGFRIELGEIENQLREFEGVKEVAVVVKKDSSGLKYLSAYLTADHEIPVEQLKECAGKQLPEYMVPNEYTIMKELPLTENGKINRKQLAQLENIRIEKAVEEEPVTQKEKIMLAVWKEIFADENIGIYDNFFSLGGDSIKAIQITSRLTKQGLKLKVADLLKYATIKNCATNIQRNKEEAEQGLVQGPVELTPIQKSFVEELYAPGNHFCQSILLHSQENIDMGCLKDAFAILFQHHDALRMDVEELDGTLYHFNQGSLPGEFEINCYELREDSQTDYNIFNYSKKLQETMQLESDVLMKAEVYKTTKGDFLFITAHHLIMDGISWRIILEDLENVYNALLNNRSADLPAKTRSFKAWAESLLNYANSDQIMEEIEYWNAISDQFIDKLPVDYHIEKRVAADMESVKISLEEDETKKIIKEIHEKFHTEINDILLTAVVMALSEWSGNCKFKIHLEGHGREEIEPDIDISRTVGWFTTVYPVIFAVNDTNDLSQLINTVKRTMREIPAKGIGYGALKYLRADQESIRFSSEKSPEIIFNYLGQFDDKSGNRFIVSSKKTYSDKGAEIKEPYKLRWNAYTSNSEFVMEIKYSNNEYRRETIERLKDLFGVSIRKIIEYCTSFSTEECKVEEFDHDELSLDDLSEIVNFINS